MASSTKTILYNHALSLLGAGRIQSPDQDHDNSRALNDVYDTVLEDELRKNVWSFAIKRVQLAASTSAPVFGRKRAFGPLPADFLRLLPRYPEDESYDRDWIIEGEYIVSDESAPLNIRYVSKVTDVSKMDSSFRRALAYALAIELAEKVKKMRPSKLELLVIRYEQIVADAAQTTAIETVPVVPPEDDWLRFREKN